MRKDAQQKNACTNLEKEIQQLKKQLKAEKEKNALLKEKLARFTQSLPRSLKNEGKISAIAHELDNFNNLATPAWEEDFSEASNVLQTLYQKGITNLDDYFQANKKDFFNLLKKVRIVRLNKAARVFLNEQRQVDFLHNIYASDSYSSILEQFKTIQKKGLRLTTELPVSLPDGEKKYYILKWVAVDGHTNYDRVLVSLINITDRHLMEKELQETNRQLSTLISNLKGIVYQCLNDQDWTMLFISDMLNELTGFAPEELLNNQRISYADIIHPEDRTFVEQGIKNALQKNERFTIEYRIITKTGQEKWVWEQGVGIKNEYGHIETLEGYIVDITERKKAEQALQESEEKFKRAFQSSPTIIILTMAHDGRIIEANDSFEQIIGWKKEEYINQTTRSLGLWANPENREEYTRLLIQHGEVKNKEYDFCLKNGEVRNALVSGHLMELSYGKVILGVLTDITEQKQSRLIINNDRIHLRTVIETIPDLVWLKDPNGIYLNCNYQFEQLLGAKEADIVGKTDYDFVKKELADAFRKHDKAAIKADQPRTNLEWVTYASDGHRALLETIKTPMKDCNGTLVGVLGVARDITEKKKNEDALKQSEILYKAIFNNKGTATCIIAEDKTLLLVNEKLEELTGYSKDELENKKKWTDFVSAEYLERMEHFREAQKVAGGKTPKEEEFILIDRKNKKHHILLSIDLIAGTTMSVASLLDITVRINALNELKRSHEKYQNLVENLNDVIFEIDNDWNFNYLSPNIEVMTGYPVNHYIGQPLSELIHPEDLKNLAYNFNDLLGKEIQKHIEFRLKSKDSRLVWFGISAKPIWDDEGKIIGARGLGVDITHKKETEIALIKAKEEAEAADRLKSAFLATMSHELRTPLNAIIGFSQLMDDTVSKDNMIKMADIIYDSGNHLLSIIESIFELSMLQSRQSKIRVENFFLNDLYKNLRFFIEGELQKQHKTKLKVSFKEFNTNYKLELQTDKTRLTQLLTNFLSNAVKYTEEGLINVGYTIDKKDVTFYVKDSGIGIPPNKQHLIFERFRQLDDSSTRKHGGVGLGLAICKEISELLDGNIWVESEPGKGSTFYFQLANIIVNRLEGEY